MESYRYEIYCLNCGVNTLGTKPRGTERPSKELCSNCGCMTDTKCGDNLDTLTSPDIMPKSNELMKFTNEEKLENTKKIKNLEYFLCDFYKGYFAKDMFIYSKNPIEIAKDWFLKFEKYKALSVHDIWVVIRCLKSGGNEYKSDEEISHAIHDAMVKKNNAK